MRTILVIIGILIAGSTFANACPKAPVHRKKHVVVVKKTRPVKKSVWVPGHWTTNRRGIRVWVAGHWRRV